MVIFHSVVFKHLCLSFTVLTAVTTVQSVDELLIHIYSIYIYMSRLYIYIYQDNCQPIRDNCLINIQIATVEVTLDLV